MRLEVEVINYTGEETVREKHILPLAEAIALKAEVDQQENKAAPTLLCKYNLETEEFNFFCRELDTEFCCNSRGDKVQSPIEAIHYTEDALNEPNIPRAAFESADGFFTTLLLATAI